MLGNIIGNSSCFVSAAYASHELDKWKSPAKCKYRQSSFNLFLFWQNRINKWVTHLFQNMLHSRHEQYGSFLWMFKLPIYTLRITGSLNVYTSMTTEQNPFSDRDHVIWSDVQSKQVRGPWFELVLSTAASKIKNELSSSCWWALWRLWTTGCLDSVQYMFIHDMLRLNVELILYLLVSCQWLTLDTICLVWWGNYRNALVLVCVSLDCAGLAWYSPEPLKEHLPGPHSFAKIGLTKALSFVCIWEASLCLSVSWRKQTLRYLEPLVQAESCLVTELKVR